MISEPRIEYNPSQPFIVIRAQVPIPFGSYLTPLWKEGRAWLDSQGIGPSGAPFIRYLTTEM
jgi:hypothetical protein